MLQQQDFKTMILCITVGFILREKIGKACTLRNSYYFTFVKELNYSFSFFNNIHQLSVKKKHLFGAQQGTGNPGMPKLTHRVEKFLAKDITEKIRQKKENRNSECSKTSQSNCLNDQKTQIQNRQTILLSPNIKFIKAIKFSY